VKVVARVLAASLLSCVVACAPSVARADESAPSARKPRNRTCCALASHLPLHLGSAHVPLALGLVASGESLGTHSYTGWDRLHETNALVYTSRGGFIDIGHTRDYADLTAYLAVALREPLAEGRGAVVLEPHGGELRVVVTKAVPRDALADTSVRVAQRIAFQVSIWSEIVQYYGRGKVRGVEEIYSAFTPEDLYSNLLGTYVGARALASPRPYDRAVDAEIRTSLRELGVASSERARAVLAALGGHWWRIDTAWPSAELAIARSFDLGPHLAPVLPPAEALERAGVLPALQGGAAAAAAVLEVPEVDASGAPLDEVCHLEVVPARDEMPRLADLGTPTVVTAAELPRLALSVRDSVAASAEVSQGVSEREARDPASPLAHYLEGLRLVDLSAEGGVAPTAGDRFRGVGGGALTAVHGDTRGGDFGFARFGLGYTSERGLVSSFSLFRSDALYFCRDPETKSVRPPLVSLLGPCSPGEWLGFGGAVGEGFHDGSTGRTAVRPVALHGVLNLLGNGQAASYDRVRLLVRGGGAVEHVWTAQEGGVTLPRLAGGALLLARAASGHIEARGAAGYRIDPTRTRDTAFESAAALRWYFLLGGHESAKAADGVDPWGVASLGVVGSYSYWTRPAHAYPDLAPAWVSATRSDTWQVLLTATLGFEGLTF